MLRIDRYNYPNFIYIMDTIHKYRTVNKQKRRMFATHLLDLIETTPYKVFLEYCSRQFESSEDSYSYFLSKWIEMIDNVSKSCQIDYVSNSFTLDSLNNFSRIVDSAKNQSLFSLLGKCSGVMILGDYVIRYSIIEDFAWLESYHRIDKDFYSTMSLWDNLIPSIDDVLSGTDYEMIEKQKSMYACIAILLLKRFGEVEEVEALGKKNTRVSETEEVCNGSPYSVTFVDCSWLRTIIRNEGFLVRGFFRLQPYGVGRLERKLIYIEPFMKQGYTRRAKKLVAEEKEMKYAVSVA